MAETSFGRLYFYGIIRVHDLLDHFNPALGKPCYLFRLRRA
jgi:hypothetical protein